MSDDGLTEARARVREAFGVHGWNPSSLLIEAVARAAREDYADVVAGALEDAATSIRYADERCKVSDLCHESDAKILTIRAAAIRAEASDD